MAMVAISATRNVHLMSKGRSMTPPPQIQPR